MKYGVQLYGAMDLFRADPKGFLEELSRMGYTQIEPCLAFDTTVEALQANGVKPVWMPEEFGTFQAMAKDAGLAVSSCFLFGDPCDHLELLMDMAKQYGIHAFVAGCCDDPSVFEQSVAGYRRAGRALAQVGAELWLHNGYPDCEATYNGKPLYEATVEACGEDAFAQVDTGWALYGGVDPVGLITRLGKCIHCIHHKDIRGTHAQVSPDRHFMGLGKGLVDMKAVKAAMAGLSVPELIDQDDSDGSLMEDYAVGIALLRSLD